MAPPQLLATPCTQHAIVSIGNDPTQRVLHRALRVLVLDTFCQNFCRLLKNNEGAMRGFVEGGGGGAMRSSRGPGQFVQSDTAHELERLIDPCTCHAFFDDSACANGACSCFSILNRPTPPSRSEMQHGSRPHRR